MPTSLSDSLCSHVFDVLIVAHQVISWTIIQWSFMIMRSFDIAKSLVVFYMFWNGMLYWLVRRPVLCMGGQCGQKTKINWTKTAHHTQAHLGLVPLHTSLLLLLCVDGLSLWFLSNMSHSKSHQQQLAWMPSLHGHQIVKSIIGAVSVSAVRDSQNRLRRKQFSVRSTTTSSLWCRAPCARSTLFSTTQRALISTPANWPSSIRSDHNKAHSLSACHLWLLLYRQSLSCDYADVLNSILYLVWRDNFWLEYQFGCWCGHPGEGGGSCPRSFTTGRRKGFHTFND